MSSKLLQLTEQEVIQEQLMDLTWLKESCIALQEGSMPANLIDKMSKGIEDFFDMVNVIQSIVMDNDVKKALDSIKHSYKIIQSNKDGTFISINQIKDIVPKFVALSKVLATSLTNASTEGLFYMAKSTLNLANNIVQFIKGFIQTLMDFTTNSSTSILKKIKSLYQKYMLKRQVYTWHAQAQKGAS